MDVLVKVCWKITKWTKTKARAIRIQCISLKVRKRMEAKTNIHCGWILSCIWFTRTKKFATCYFPIIFLIGTFVVWPTLIFWVLLMGSIISQLLCFFFFINFTENHIYFFCCRNFGCNRKQKSILTSNMKLCGFENTVLAKSVKMLFYIILLI